MPYVKPKTIGSSAHPSHSSFPQESAVQSSPRPSAHIAKDTLELNKMTDDLPTPRPASTLPHPMSDEDKIKDLEKALQSTSLYPTDTIPQEQTIPPTSSSTSLVSLHAESTYELSVSETEQSELGTPPTSAGDNTPDLAVGVVGDDGEDPLARYKEGLYAYTRTLYLEAKLSQSRKAETKNSNQFGLKQSGMEKMAAKKALARRLNA